MRHRTHRLRLAAALTALALAPLLVAAGWAPVRAQLPRTCGMPCCKAPAPDGDAHISRTPCCEVGKAPATRRIQVPSSVASPRPVASLVGAVVLALVELPAPVLERAAAPVVPERATSPPILVSKQSFLI